MGLSETASNRAKSCAQNLGSRIIHETNQKLINTAAEQNPLTLFDNLRDYYRKQQSEVGFLDYIKRFRINMSKTARYVRIARQINKDINAPIIIPGQENSDTDYENDLAAIEADTLKKTIWEREWPLESIKCDLQDQQSKLQDIQNAAQRVLQSLSIVEAQDGGLEYVCAKIEVQLSHTAQAIKTIEHRQKIYSIHVDPIDFLVRKAQKGTLKKKLDEVISFYPLAQINATFKASNSDRNSIVHALCDRALPPEQFNEIIESLTKGGQNMNEMNGAGESILDYAENKQLDMQYIEIIKKHGGFQQANLKSILKSPARVRRAGQVLKLSDDKPSDNE